MKEIFFLLNKGNRASFVRRTHEALFPYGNLIYYYQ